MIKHQEELLKTIDSLSQLPHSILLLGEYGSGHEAVCEYISTRFNLVMHNITEHISHEYIDEINSSQTPSLYFINMSEISEREQNIILKLYEEPSRYCHIVLNCELEDNIIDTIKSRSYILKLARYQKEYLYELIQNKDSSELILNICTTPGQIEIANYTDFKKLYDLCSKIFSSMSRANFQNALSISNKINFKDEYDKFDLTLFLKMLKFVLIDTTINNKLQIYELLSTCSKYIRNMGNKQLYFENMLINLWELSHKE